MLWCHRFFPVLPNELKLWHSDILEDLKALSTMTHLWGYFIYFSSLLYNPACKGRGRGNDYEVKILMRETERALGSGRRVFYSGSHKGCCTRVQGKGRQLRCKSDSGRSDRDVNKKGGGVAFLTSLMHKATRLKKKSQALDWIAGQIMHLFLGSKSCKIIVHFALNITFFVFEHPPRVTGAFCF